MQDDPGLVFDGPVPNSDDPALVFEEHPPGGGPVTHVLVVGIGTYDYLLDGVHENAEVADGMGQIPSAAKSARVMAEWFLDSFVNKEKPLGSLALVLSEPTPAQFQHPRCRPPNVALPEGSVDSISEAMARFVERASKTSGDMIIIYLAGHGLYAGRSLLLCRDYGHRRIQRFERSINIDGFLAALATMQPSEQLILIDACRVPDEVGIQAIFGTAHNGRALLTPVDLGGRGGVLAAQSVHFATSPLSLAWARGDDVSIYCKALISAIGGGGAQASDHWWVTTSGLQEALTVYVRRNAFEEGVEQEPDRLRSSAFRLCLPTQTDVPVYVTCEPNEVWQLGFRLRAHGRAGERNYVNEPGQQTRSRQWALRLPRSMYSFAASFDVGTEFEDRVEEGILVVPPETPVSLKISKRIG